jgi:hypothetical protein
MTIFYLHIPKAGGSTLTHILDRNFKNSKQYKYSTTNPTQSMKLLKNVSQNVDLVSGHFVYGFHEWLDIEAPKYITLVRNPVDRVVSHYYYSARKEDHYLYNIRKHGDITLVDYVKTLCPEVQNGMAKQVAGMYVNDNFGYAKGIKYCDDQKKLLEIAIDNIEKSFIMIGLSEQFDYSLMLLKRILGGAKFKYNYYRKNQNLAKIGEQYDTSSKVRNIIEEYNVADIKLYEYCKNKFDQDVKTFLGHQSPLKFETQSLISKKILDMHRKINNIL